MSMSISSSSALASSSNFDPSKKADRIASRMMKELDPNNSGSITKDKFVAGLESKGVSADNASKQFDAIDTQKTGSITKSDIETAIKSGALKAPTKGSSPSEAKSARPAGGGPPPAGGSGGAKASGSSSEDSSKTYEAADTNKDGTVSAQEAMVYSMTHPTTSSTTGQTDPSKLGKNLDVTA